MLKKLAKVESFINAKLNQLIEKITLYIKSKIPSRAFIIRDNSIKKIQDYKIKAQERAKARAIRTGEFITYTRDKIFGFLDSLQTYPYKEKIKNIAAKIAELSALSPKELVKRTYYYILTTIDGIKEKLGKPTFGISFMYMLSAIFAVWGVYTASKALKDIWSRELDSYVGPASVEVYPEKPAYFLKKEKTMAVLNIAIPVFVEDINAIKTITIDFSVTTSTRFARLYLEENEDKLKDHFFTTTEPILSSFPLEKEGKDVLKEKIRDELDIFLKQEKVEGEVTDVHLLYILGT